MSSTSVSQESRVPGAGADGEAAAAQQRFKRLALILFAAWLLLTSSNQGEFWPFSRFPMFSRAARPWLRSTVRELNEADLAQPLVEVWENELPGRPFRLARHRIHQDDLSEVIRKFDDPLTGDQAALLARYFEGPRRTRTLVLYAVRGSLRPTDRSVRIRYRPIAVMDRSGVRAIVDGQVRGEATGGAP